MIALLQDATPRPGLPLVHFNDTCRGSAAELQLLDQMELALVSRTPGPPFRVSPVSRKITPALSKAATEDEIAAERAVAKITNVVAFTRKRPARQPFPEHLPRERVIEPGPTTGITRRS